MGKERKEDRTCVFVKSLSLKALGIKKEEDWGNSKILRRPSLPTLPACPRAVLVRTNFAKLIPSSPPPRPGDCSFTPALSPNKTRSSEEKTTTTATTVFCKTVM